MAILSDFLELANNFNSFTSILPENKCNLNKDRAY